MKKHMVMKLQLLYFFISGGLSILFVLIYQTTLSNNLGIVEGLSDRGMQKLRLLAYTLGVVFSSVMPFLAILLATFSIWLVIMLVKGKNNFKVIFASFNLAYLLPFIFGVIGSIYRLLVGIPILKGDNHSNWLLVAFYILGILIYCNKNRLNWLEQ